MSYVDVKITIAPDYLLYEKLIELLISEYQAAIITRVDGLDKSYCDFLVED